jgi:dienelactone hydrolase
MISKRTDRFEGLRAALFAALVIVMVGGCSDGPVSVLKCGRLKIPNEDQTLCRALEAVGQDAEVSFESQSGTGPIQLKGTLTMPKFSSGSGAPARLPAVILVADEGPMTRDGILEADIGGSYGAPVPVLKELAGALSAKGYVVLRYDKRTCTTCGYPPEQAASATWQDLVGDIVAASKMLASLPRVDPLDIILIGHGQGATLALEAQRDIKPSELVLLGANFFPIDSVLIARARWGVDTAGDKKAKNEAEKRLSEVESSMLAVRDGSFPEDYMVLDRHRADFWMAWLATSDKIEGLLNEYRGPVLVLRGSDDPNVSPAEIAGFQNTLSGRSNSQTLGSLPETSHAFHRRGGPATLEPNARQSLTSWLGRGE